MENYIIDDKESAEDFLEYVKSIPTEIPKIKDNEVFFNGDCFEVENRYKYVLRRINGTEFRQPDKKGERTVRSSERHQIVSRIDSGSNLGVGDVVCDNSINSLVFGKDSTGKIVGAEVADDQILLFKADGTVEKRDMEYYILSSRKIGADSERLEGDLFYKYRKVFTNSDNYIKARGILYSKKTPMYTIYDPVEAYMIMNGLTFFKELKVIDVSVLSFDLETTGVAHNEDSKVLMISNTFRDYKGLSRKLFALDDYESEEDMIQDWEEWVKTVDPSFVIGHNIYWFDLPYLSFRCMELLGRNLIIGKNESWIKYAQKPKKVGALGLDVFEAKIFGRQIIDTWILAMAYDIGKNYTNYKLKNIIFQEGLEKKDRTKWDFEKIMPNEIWAKFKDGDIEMWNDFKKYCIEDSDDSLKLYDLMISQYFYYAQSLPMPFQTVALTKTGRQINGFMCRSYLQHGYSIPAPSEKLDYQGAISFGNPGVYSNVYKVDVASLYPSIMITEKVYDRDKDPKGNFLAMVEHFTKERLENKQKAKDTGDRYYKDLEQAQKIVINSAYGLLGTAGVNFNSMANADLVTAKGREILTEGIKWVEDNEFQVVNVDTDSFSYTSGGKKTAEVFEAEIADINSRFKDGIIWEDDGYFKKFIVVKAKNYILYDGKTVKIKGQALKGTGKEKALTDFMNRVIMLLLKNKKDHIFEEYRKVALEIRNNWDVNEWLMKKTVTKAVLKPGRLQEQKVFDAIQDINYQEGDKVYLFVKDSDSLSLAEKFDGTYDADKYYQKLHDTLSILDTLLDPTLFPNYKLGRNKDLL